MDLVRGVDLAILIASIIFAALFGWLYLRERKVCYLLWGAGCLMFGARYFFFWEMAGRDPSAVPLVISVTMVFLGFVLLNNGLWIYIGFGYAPWANMLAGFAYLGLLSAAVMWDAPGAPVHIGYAYLAGGCLCAFTAIQFFLMPRIRAVLYWRVLGCLLFAWFIQGIWVTVSMHRSFSSYAFIMSTGLLFACTVIFILLSRLQAIGADLAELRIEMAAGAMRTGWFEILPDTEEIIMSSRSYRALGYAPNEFPQRIADWVARMDEAGRERALGLLRHMQGRKRPQSFSCEFRVQAKGGQYRYIIVKGFCIQTNAMGKPVRYVGISFDLTEEKMMMETLAAKNRQITHAENQKKAILDSIPDAMLYLDLDWHVMLANAAASKLLRYPVSEMYGKSFGELLGPDQAVADLCLVAGQNPEGKMVIEEVETRSGRIWRLRIRPVTGASGGTDGYVVVIEDRTEEHIREEQRIQVEKMMAIGQMAGGLAHDLKNQMMVTLGNLSLIEEAVSRDTKAYEYIKRVENATKGTKDLIDNLLSFARKRPIEYARMNTHEVIETSVQLLQHSLAPNVTIQTFLHARHCVIRGDIYQMQNAIFNLAINARDAMPEGGFLSIETQCVRVEAEQTFQYSQRLEPGDYIRISISDTGCGMDESVIKRIFEPFFTTKPSGKGTGLGLSMVFGTVQAHHGAINVFSQPGEGTIFDIYLPLIEAYEEEEFSEESLAQYRLI